MQAILDLLNEPGPVRWVVDVIGLPLLAVAAVFGLRSLFLLIPFKAPVFEGYRRVRRQTSKVTAAILSILAVGLVWRIRLTDLAERTAGTAQEGLVLQDLVWGIGRAALITASLLLLLFLLQRAYRAAQNRVSTLGAGTRGIRFQGAMFVSPARIRQLISVGLRLARLTVILVLLYFYVPLLLSFIPATRPLADQVMPALMGPAANIGSAIVGYIPNLITLVFIIFLVRYLLRFVRFFMTAVGKEEIRLPGFDPEWAEQTQRLIRIALILATVMIAYPFLPGAGSDVFRGFSLFVGALFTLGASSSVSNAISGIILTYTGSFRIDDRVEIGNTLGDVVGKGLFVTRIRTPLNELVTVPNTVALGGKVVNYSAQMETSSLTLRITVGIGYEVDWRQVHQLLKQAALATENIVAEPEPTVLQDSLGDYAVVYSLLAQTDDPKAAIRTRSELRRSVLDTFNKAGVEIMTPAVNAVRNATEPTIPDDYVEGSGSSGLRFLGLQPPAAREPSGTEQQRLPDR